MLKNPARNCSLCEPRRAKFLNTVRSWVDARRRAEVVRRDAAARSCRTAAPRRSRHSRSFSPTSCPPSRGSHVKAGARPFRGPEPDRRRPASRSRPRRRRCRRHRQRTTGGSACRSRTSRSPTAATRRASRGRAGCRDGRARRRAASRSTTRSGRACDPLQHPVGARADRTGSRSEYSPLNVPSCPARACTRRSTAGALPSAGSASPAASGIARRPS